MEREGTKIVCRNCGAVVTDTERAIEVSGRHAHKFMSPTGFVYKVRCFSEVPGGFLYGSPIAEYTWFAGYTYGFLDCASCGSQIGWGYEGKRKGAKPPEFCVLIDESVGEMA